jgi:hypothetical protein
VRCVVLQLRCLLMDLSIGLELGPDLGIGVIDGCMCYDGYTWSPVKHADSLYTFAFGLLLILK